MVNYLDNRCLFLNSSIAISEVRLCSSWNIVCVLLSSVDSWLDHCLNLFAFKDSIMGIEFIVSCLAGNKLSLTDLLGSMSVSELVVLCLLIPFCGTVLQVFDQVVALSFAPSMWYLIDSRLTSGLEIAGSLLAWFQLARLEMAIDPRSVLGLHGGEVGLLLGRGGRAWCLVYP